MPCAVAAAQIPRDITSKYKTALQAACRERSFYGATPAGVQSAHGPAHNRRTVQRTIGARSSAQSAHDPVHNRRTVQRTIGARSGARSGAQSAHGLAYNRRTVWRTIRCTIKRTIRRNCAQVGMRQSGLRVASPGLRGNVRGVGRSLRTTISRESRPGTPAGSTRASPPPNRRSASPAWLSSSSAAGPL